MPSSSKMMTKIKIKTHEVNKIDDLRNHMIDHVLLLRENKVYLMIHGNEQGIVYNGT